MKEVITELRRWGVPENHATISTNVTAGAENASDVGVAVYFRREKKDFVIACDTWDRPACNLIACARTLEAFRMFDRYGIQTGEEVLSAFAALPASASAADGQRWHEVLGCSETATLDEAQAAFRERAQIAHPDKGGSMLQWDALSTAWDRARTAIEARRAGA